MRRQQRPIEIRLSAPDVITAEQAPGEPRLRLRVSDGGRVRARVVAASRYSTPPSLEGRITTESGGTVLEATIRESYAEVFLPRLFIGLAAFMAVVFVGLLAAGDFTSPGVYVCGIGGAVLLLIGYALGRSRHASFHRHADLLEHAVRASALTDPGPATTAATGP